MKRSNMVDVHRLISREFPGNAVEDWGYTHGWRGPTAYTNQLGKVWLYSYDLADRKTNEVAVGMYTNRFTYSRANDLLTLTDGKNQVTKWNYDLYGRVTNKVDQADVEILRYQYDANSRLTNRWSKAMGNTVYSYDANGNVTYVDYPAGTTDISFAYDALNRVTNMVDAAGTTKYAYHPGGRLWTEDGPWANDTVTNLYNNVGLRSSLTLQQPAGVWTNAFHYDAARRLTNVTGNAGSFTYTLGGAGPASSLIKKIALPNTSYIISTYDGIRLIQERNASNNPLVAYTRGTDLSGSLEGAGGIGGLLARSHSYTTGGGGLWLARNFYHADGNGNITAMLNISQTSVASYRYDPFGNTISQSGTLADANTYRFSSKPVHAKSGMYYYGYRFYDPEMQRWLNRDPIGELGGLNLYSFVVNAPINYVDPFGLRVTFNRGKPHTHPDRDCEIKCRDDYFDCKVQIMSLSNMGSIGVGFLIGTLVGGGPWGGAIGAAGSIFAQMIACDAAYAGCMSGCPTIQCTGGHGHRPPNPNWKPSVIDELSRPPLTIMD